MAEHTVLKLVAVATALAALGLVALSSSAPRTSALESIPIVDKVDAKFWKTYNAKQHQQDLATVQTAAKTFAKFGGSFKNGVASNTWAGTPYGKYDKDAKTEQLAMKRVQPGWLFASAYNRRAAVRAEQSKGPAAHQKMHKAMVRHAAHKKGVKPTWLFGDAYHWTPQKSEVPKAQKEVFWEGLGDTKNAKQSRGRSLRSPAQSFHPNAPDYRAFKAQKTTMLYENNAKPYYIPGEAGTQQAHSGGNGGNPYAQGWAQMKSPKNMGQLYSEIDQQLQPLAQEYPYIRAIRH
mmetsp:Transcript_6111/g.9743  ORF Transcript_6111/g.9743 Transcript_6111/m.9743 type:complete len:291 (-) Transcript_6111:75-947(-)|eukprot:CAMPEP_0184292630 /NCGR_PEP_ID=MMETSP1049-20130417/4363_1 /TAXON_ID=77928 /ORGANISM="Proteomonas sulcata, Strain CCMP704" /LENGTH=290 /DNA_ID=CAMNT_0026600461 /DNA_START=9 /DNA_END=881 /DNA_ORIENTATION=-